ncbi:MAG TPA: hypothetical protein VJW55_03660, partial [Candidatus Angelobacter sp.]|nr:hypothetical protein [Candidatus Angelobacter sp.]
DHGAHGTFDALAHEKSWELRTTLNRLWIGAGLGITAAGIFLLARHTREQEPAKIEPFEQPIRTPTVAVR